MSIMKKLFIRAVLLRSKPWGSTLSKLRLQAGWPDASHRQLRWMKPQTPQTFEKFFSTFASQKPPFGRPAFLLVSDQNVNKNRAIARFLLVLCQAFFKKLAGVGGAHGFALRKTAPFYDKRRQSNDFIIKKQDTPNRLLTS